ncbi:ElyC/SanA/YdcF family protein [Actinoplanes sp. NBRC 103695]|uniref:SanA/YdcF family protein n=1 Tax=Actinoplanes sp. NBRC 103695 TaxID=3032202 RepID=UPI0025527A62|nr:ElyC/SanA/YdcF family protein [Actinoplanes sp. NBRC 103695]
MRWLRRRVAIPAAALLVLAAGPWVWTELGARGHEHDEAGAPAAPVTIVLGTGVEPDGRPSPRLAGRLQTAAELVRSGRTRVVLVSGDGSGESGDETGTMTAYLVNLGVDPRLIVADPHGLDTYDSCVRARDVYGIDRALVVTQEYHLSRAVTLCRGEGVAAEGVAARCPGCGTAFLAGKAGRDFFASMKAAWDSVRGRAPAVTSPPDPAVAEALKVNAG